MDCTIQHTHTPVDVYTALMPREVTTCKELWSHQFLLFRALSVILYLAFLFMVVIVLLNVLIAQVSDTYTKVLATAPEVFLSHQCWYMARIEQQKYAACLPCIFPRMLRWCLNKIACSVSFKCQHCTLWYIQDIVSEIIIHVEHSILNS